MDCNTRHAFKAINLVVFIPIRSDKTDMDEVYEI